MIFLSLITFTIMFFFFFGWLSYFSEIHDFVLIFPFLFAKRTLFLSYIYMYLVKNQKTHTDSIPNGEIAASEIVNLQEQEREYADRFLR